MRMFPVWDNSPCAVAGWAGGIVESTRVLPVLEGSSNSSNGVGTCDEVPVASEMGATSVVVACWGSSMKVSFCETLSCLGTGSDEVGAEDTKAGFPAAILSSMCCSIDLISAWLRSTLFSRRAKSALLGTSVGMFAIAVRSCCAISRVLAVFPENIAVVWVSDMLRWILSARCAVGVRYPVVVGGDGRGGCGRRLSSLSWAVVMAGGFVRGCGVERSDHLLQ
jgi:hypothetical protein